MNDHSKEESSSAFSSSLEQRAEQLAAVIAEHCILWTRRDFNFEKAERWILDALQSAAHRQDAEIEKLRKELTDANQQLDVLRPGGLYAWKSKYEALQAELQSAAHRGLVEGLREAARIAEGYLHHMLPLKGQRDSLDQKAAYSNGTVQLIMSDLHSRAEGVSPPEEKTFTRGHRE